MPAFGVYETVEEIPSRPWVFVATVRPIGETEPPQWVLKTTRSMAGLDTPAEAEQRRLDLLQSAAVQDKVAQHKDSPRWAQIRETSSSASETYIIMDRYDRSAADLSRQRRLTRSELRTLSLAVLEGLEEIGSCCGRGHGRLSAANVLLRSKGDSVLGEIVLCDPAPEMPDAGVIDLRDFGFLVRHLATGYEDRAGEPPESAWAHLGGAAAFWRDLSNELIHLDAEVRAVDLPGLVARIEKGATTERRWKVPAATTMLVAFCIGILGWVLYTQEPKVQLEELHDEWQVLCIEGDGWSNGLWKPLKRQRDLVSNRFDKEDPLRMHIELRLGEVDMLLVMYEESIPPDETGLRHPEELSLATSDILLHLEERSRPWAFLSPREFQNGVEAAHAAVMTLRNSLSDKVGEGGERWELHEEFDRLKATIYSKDEWNGIDTLIDTTVKGVSPESYLRKIDAETQDDRHQPKAAQQLAVAIVDVAELEYRLSKLAEMWSEAKEAVRELEKNAGDDPVLGRAGELLESAAVGMPEDSTWDIHAVETVSMHVEAALGPLRLARDRVADASWSKTETRLLNIAAKKLRESEGIKPETFKMWASLARDHGRLDGESPVAALIADLEIERVRLNRIVGDDTNQDTEARTLREDIHDLNDLLQLRNSAWILKHETEILGSATELRPRVQSLTDRVGDFEITSDEMLVTLRSASDVFGDSAPLQAYRERQRLEWIVGLESNSLQPYKVNRSFEQLNTSLNTLADEYPALEVPSVPAAFDEAMIASAVQEERGRTLEQALDMVSADWALGAYAVSDSDTEALLALADGREQWLQDSAAILQDLASASARLLAYESLEGVDSAGQDPQQLLHKWMAKDIYTELGGDESFGSLVRLAADLEGVQSADRPALMSWVSEHETKPQRAYASWRRLGAYDRLWPATEAEIEQAVEYIGAVMLVFASDTKLAARADEFRIETANRWSDSVEGMMARQDWAGMKMAFKTMPSFGVDIGEQAAGVRLNAALYSLSESAASGEDSIARAGLVSYRDAVSSVVLDSQRLYEEVLQSFEAEAAEGTNVEALTGAGPGSSGWAGELDRTDANGRLGEVLRFRGGGGYELEFHLIEEQANPPRLVYLSTAEVSIGVAGWALGRDAGRSEIEDIWSVLTATQWDGPRTWKLTGSALIATPAREDWFRWSPLAQSRNDKFAPAVQFDESIAADHRPIQHISFAAAEMLADRLGCRLPTKDEWIAASARRTVGGTANLRDASFGFQQAHVKQVDSQLPYPDDGTFTPTDTPLGPNAVDGQGADNTLFFLAVGGVGGFEHMVGNVAEWVLVDGKPGVIGGSALSHPTQDHRVPHKLSGRNTRGRSFSDVGFRLALQIEGTLKPSIATLIQDWFKAEPRYVATAE